MIKIREDFIKLENIDPLWYITIASVCMTIYRSNYMPKKRIAVVPEYVKTDNFSKTSIMWLEYMSKNDTNIQHALNGSEKELIINNKTYKSRWLLQKKQYHKRILWVLLACLHYLLPIKYRKQ